MTSVPMPSPGITAMRCVLVMGFLPVGRMLVGRSGRFDRADSARIGGVGVVARRQARVGAAVVDQLGTSSAHTSVAFQQRVRKRHPLGGERDSAHRR